MGIKLSKPFVFDDKKFEDTLEAVQFLESQGYVVEQAQYWEW